MVELKKIGKIAPKTSKQIRKSRIGLGFEKLDRDIFDPEKSYPFVAESGIKYARLQSGWQKTEQAEGVYDFAWLDRIVDKMIEIGVEPWVCLCYGNPVYTEGAEKVFGAVGCPPVKTERERVAWANYTRTLVDHFKGRVHYYEIWNEPDGVWCWKHGPNVDELAEFTFATARACKEADPTCEVIGLATCMPHKEFLEPLCDKGICDVLDAISYHAYTPYEHEFKTTFEFYDRLRKKYNPKMKIIQGESGTQSRADGCGALAGGAWTEQKQTKYLLRHLITDLSCGVEFASYFSCMDMAEALNGESGNLSSISDFGYFGVVGADFDEEARATGNYHTKPSYYALQTLTSILCEDYDCADVDVEAVREYSRRMCGMNFDFSGATRYWFERKDGGKALFYWNPKDILTETYDGETSFSVAVKDAGSEAVLIDMTDGSIYELDEQHCIRENDRWHFKNLPITDVPLLLSFDGFHHVK